MDVDWTIVGGFLAGALAGFAARYGRLCTMTAIEDALVAGDLRGVRAWAIALAVAVAATAAGEASGVIDLTGAHVLTPRLPLAGVLFGGLMFGLGMTLVGTCSFGLLVRVGTGDLRAAIAAAVVGIVAMAATAGLLAPVYTTVSGLATIDLSAVGGMRLDAVAGALAGRPAAIGVVGLLIAAPLVLAFADRRMWKRPRLMVGAVTMGLAVAVGWMVTSRAVAEFELARAESLSFVAPVGRALLHLMTDGLRGVGFGMAAVAGVVAASLATSAWLGEVRAEAFDDAGEMVRHLAGSVLMGLGGVLAHGCTIGQGLTASSALAISAPLFWAAVLIGARMGLAFLLTGHGWRTRRV